MGEMYTNPGAIQPYDMAEREGSLPALFLNAKWLRPSVSEIRMGRWLECCTFKLGTILRI